MTKSHSNLSRSEENNRINTIRILRKAGFDETLPRPLTGQEAVDIAQEVVSRGNGYRGIFAREDDPERIILQAADYGVWQFEAVADRIVKRRTGMIGRVVRTDR